MLAIVITITLLLHGHAHTTRHILSGRYERAADSDCYEVARLWRKRLPRLAKRHTNGHAKVTCERVDDLPV